MIPGGAMKTKTLAIGIDGACWEYMTPLLKKGELPNLQKLISNGCYGTARSTIPHISSVAWSSFITGMFPKNNGIFDWCIEAKDHFRPVFSSDREGRSFWHYLNDAYLKVGVFNLPLTFPPENVDGFFISGFDSPVHNERRVFPKEVFFKLSEKYGYDFLKPPDKNILKTEEGQKQYTNDYINHIEVQTTIALDLIDEYNIDVFINNFMIVDHLNHRVRDFKLIEKGIVAVDKNIGRFVEMYPDANYIIFSDHGSNRIDTVFMVYNWLEQNNFIKYSKKKYEFTKLNTLISNILKQNLLLNDRFEKVLRRMLLIPAVLLPSFLIGSFINSFSKLFPKMTFYPYNAIDFAKSKVKYCSVGCHGFYLDIDDTEEYNETRTELAKLLLQLKNPKTKNPLYDHVYFKEDLTDNKFKERAPDLLAHPIEPFFLCQYSVIQNSESLRKVIFTSSDIADIYGQHIDEGISIFSGPEFKKGINNYEISITDIAAYILNVNLIPIPDNFNACIEVEDVLNDKTLTKHKSIKSHHDRNDRNTKEVQLSEEDEAKIKEELSKLGYM